MWELNLLPAGAEIVWKISCFVGNSRFDCAFHRCIRKKSSVHVVTNVSRMCCFNMLLKASI